jgi:hypothetical protein
MTVLASAEVERTPVDDIFDRFARDFREGIELFAAAICGADAPLLVAISRKAPRLLDFINSEPSLPNVALDSCISEKALAYEPAASLQGAKVLLVDDTLIFGSTFAGVERRLLKAGATPANLVLARSRSASGSMFDRVDAPITLTGSQIHNFIDLEIQAFGSLAIPYDIDHPICQVSADDSAPILDWLIASSRVTETSRRWQRAHSVRVYSHRVDDEIRNRHSQRDRQSGPAKVRLFVNELTGEVKAVPIFCLALLDTDLSNLDLFAHGPEFVKAAWPLLIDAVDKGSADAEERQRALAYGAHYLAGIELASLWADELGTELVSRPRVDEKDLRLIFGRTLAPTLADLLNDGLRRETVRPLFVDDPATPSAHCLDSSAEVVALGATEKGRLFLSWLEVALSLTTPDDHESRLFAVFEAQRRAYDEATRAEENVNAHRLEVGVPFAAIRQLVGLDATELDDIAFEAWCDAAVDGGTVVPRYARALSAPNLWVRTARFGERGSEGMRYWLHRTVTAMAEEWHHQHPGEGNAPGVPWLVAEKALVTIALALGPRLRNGVDADLDRGFDAYGARMALRDRGASRFLLDWADASRLITRPQGSSSRGGHKGRPRMVVPSERFFELHPDSLGQGSEGAKARRDMVRALRYPASRVGQDVTDPSEAIAFAFIVMDAHLRGDVRRDAILALSTCGTEAGYLQAVTTELGLWLDHGRAGASRCVDGLLSLASKEPDVAIQELAEDLQKASEFTSECLVKAAAFQGREATVSVLDQLFGPRGEARVYEGTWGDWLRPLIDLGPLSHEVDATYLRFAAAVAREATGIARAMIDPRPDRPSVRERADRYNLCLTRARERSLTLPLDGLDADPALLSSGGPEAYRAAAVVLDETRQIVESVVASWGHPRDPGTWETVADDYAVLFWDQIASSSDQDPAPGQRAVAEANHRLVGELSRLGVKGFQPSQDDGNVCLVSTVSQALVVFEVLAETFTNHGFEVKASIGTTFDSEKLTRNVRTGDFAGRPYQMAARTMSLYSEGPAQPPSDPVHYHATDGKVLDLEKPAGSYVLFSGQALRTLREAERRDVPPTLSEIAIASNYRMRVKSALPAEVHVFSWAPKFDSGS